MAGKLIVHGIKVGYWGLVNPRCSVYLFLNGKQIGGVSRRNTTEILLSGGGQLSCKGRGQFSGKPLTIADKKITEIQLDTHGGIIVFEVISSKDYHGETVAVSSTQQSHRQNVLSPTEEIKKYKELLDMGIITPDEFETKKHQLLGL